MSSAAPGPRAYWFFALAFGAWLVAWIVISRDAVQDDALIHLRYADNLYLHHFITYDGVHANYGASSLLYVGLLALLRACTASPSLPRVVSSAVHLLLFIGLATALGRQIPKEAKLSRVAAVVLLALLVTPSAVRWLDDGMETGLVVTTVSLMAWLLHQEAKTSRSRCAVLGGVAFAAVLLRTELLLLCGVGSVILLLRHRRTPGVGLLSKRELAASARPALSLAGGAAVAVGLILWTMHVLLPDTAVAKSQGIAHWLSPIHDTALTLAGAFSFGAGMLMFWLLTLALVAMRKGLTLRTMLANGFCPAVLVLSALRGQEIQGVRYFAWTFAFSVVWNILELASSEEDRTTLVRLQRADRRSAALLYLFAGALAIELPVESVAMHRLLISRGQTMRLFESQHLEVLRPWRGVASDIGTIGYFSGAEICDLAGLVNGREAARLSSRQRVEACAQTKPDFMFLGDSQFGPIAAATGLDGWKVCGVYDFSNVKVLNRHYLVVRPELADAVCRAASRQPEAVEAIFALQPRPVAGAKRREAE